MKIVNCRIMLTNKRLGLLPKEIDPFISACSCSEVRILHFSGHVLLVLILNFLFINLYEKS